MPNRVVPKLRSSRSIPGVTVGVALLLILMAGLVWAPPGEAQTGCAALIQLSPDKGQNPPSDVLTPNEVVNIGVSITQQCTTNGNFVAATVKGTTKVDLACATDGNLTDPSGTGCAVLTQQLNTLHFDSCTPAAADVTCVVGLDGNSNPTLAIITYTGACPPSPGGSTCKSLAVFPTATNIATITAHAVPGQQVISPATGKFAVTGSTGQSNVFTSAASASGQGSAPEFYPAPPPTATLTKSCSATLTGSNVVVSFTATLTNTGTFESLGNISCNDSPPTTLNGVPASLGTGSSAVITGTYSQSGLSAADTLTCTATGSSTSTVLTPTANAQCSTSANPSLSVNKSCSAALAGGGASLNVSFTATLTNNGNENLQNITCTDNPSTVLSGVPTTLAAGASATITGTYSTSSSTASDTLTCTGTGVVSTTTVNNKGSATCGTTCTPSIAVVKQCTNAVSAANPTIAFSGTVTNTGNVQLTGITCSNHTTGGTSAVTPTSTTLNTPNGTATYSGSYQGVPGPNLDTVTCTGTVPAVCGGGTVQNFDSKTCTVPPGTGLSTTQNPVSGKLGDILNDSAQVTGGNPPFTGTVTFDLWDPDQPGCGPPPSRYNQVVAISSAGTASTSPGLAADKSGTWQWTVHYSGDANNPPADSGCTAEPVVIQKTTVPTLSGWGVLIFMVLLVGVGSLMLSRRRNLTLG